MRTDLSSSAGAMARGAARGAVGALAASVLALAFQAIVRHIVDIETMGLFTVATTVVVLAQLPALFGLEAGAVRYVSLGAAAGDERRARGSAQAALIAGLVLSTAGAVALFILAPEICERFDKPEATHLLRLASLALPLLCTSRVCAACVLGFGLTGRSSTITVAQNLTRLLVTVPLVLLIADVTALGVGFAIAGLAGTMFALWLLRSVVSADPAARARPLGPALHDRLLLAADAQPEPLPGHAVDRHARARALRAPPGRSASTASSWRCWRPSRSSRSRSPRPSRRASRARTRAATAPGWHRCCNGSPTGTWPWRYRSSDRWSSCASRCSRSSAPATRPARRRS